MIIGAHTIIFSRNPDADRAFLSDVLRFQNIDAGDGWLIFKSPPAEIAVHPYRRNNLHRLYLMCDDIQAFIADMRVHGINCEKVVEAEWGLSTDLTLPGGGKLGVYQPRHQRPS